MAENASIRQLREALEQAQEGRKRLEREAAELRTYRAEKEVATRERSVRSAFRAAGLEESWGSLFLKERPGVEPTPENVLAFAQEFNLVPAQAEEPVPPSWSPPPTGPPPMP